MTDDTNESLIYLLQMIGQNTKVFTMLELTDDCSLHNWVRRVFVACPRLEELCISVASIESMNIFVNAAIASEARLNRLEIGSTGCDRMEMFFDALSDQTHPLSVHLEHLRVTFWIGQKDEIDRLIGAVLSMLSNNRRLHTIHIGLETGFRFSHLEPNAQAAFGKVPADKVPIRAAPLDLRCKHAFLSIVQNSQLPALDQLDSTSIRTIFEFAAESRTRRVEYKCISHFG